MVKSVPSLRSEWVSGDETQTLISDITAQSSRLIIVSKSCERGGAGLDLRKPLSFLAALLSFSAIV
jgi:hypothetical protein